LHVASTSTVECLFKKSSLKLSAKWNMKMIFKNLAHQYGILQLFFLCMWSSHTIWSWVPSQWWLKSFVPGGDFYRKWWSIFVCVCVHAHAHACVHGWVRGCTRI
jgi:hypothetical protein